MAYWTKSVGMWLTPAHTWAGLEVELDLTRRLLGLLFKTYCYRPLVSQENSWDDATMGKIRRKRHAGAHRQQVEGCTTRCHPTKHPCAASSQHGHKQWTPSRHINPLSAHSLCSGIPKNRCVGLGVLFIFFIFIFPCLQRKAAWK